MDKIAFKHIFDLYFDSIRSYIYYRITDEDAASDLAQDVFMRVWEKRADLEADRIKALLYKMASDVTISHYRKNAVRTDYAQHMQLDEQDASPQEQAEFEELKEKYANVLAEMPEAQRITFLMSREEELKYSEIAERLGVSVKAVEKRMSAALQLLKLRLLKL